MLLIKIELTSCEEKLDTFSTVTHAHTHVHHRLMRSTGMYKMSEGFSSAGSVRRALASFYNFDNTNTLNRGHSF